MKRSCLCLLTLLGLLSIAPSQAQWAGNGHYYELVTAPLTWNAARAEAESRTFMGSPGHLLTINSQGENDFIVATYGESLREKSIGGQLVNGQWTWITGEPFAYTNWAPGEPNYGQTGCMNFHGANDLGTWNDVPTWQVLGYFVEYELPMTFTISKAEIAGQNYLKGTIALGGPASTSIPVTMSDDSSMVSEPPTVTVPRGAVVKDFQIQTVAVNSSIVTHLTATLGTYQRSVALTLLPLVPSAMAFTPGSAAGGSTVSCRLVINGVAGPGGRTISIVDNNAFSVVPNEVTVPPGGTQVIFTIDTLPVVTTQYVTVTASVSAGSKTGNFRIVPGI